MKRQFKKQLSEAFDAPEPERKKEFLRTVPVQKMSTAEFIISQAGFIRKRIWILSAAVIIPVIYGAANASSDAVWIASAFIPFLALLLVSETSKSVTYGMYELEMASRFSLRSAVSARLIILGLLDLLILCIVTPLCAYFENDSVVQTGLYFAVPYLLTAFSGLQIVRKFHGRDNIYGCLAAAVLISCADGLLRFNLRSAFSPENTVWWAAAALVLAVLLAGCVYRITGKEDKEIWNCV